MTQFKFFYEIDPTACTISYYGFLMYGTWKDYIQSLRLYQVKMTDNKEEYWLFYNLSIFCILKIYDVL